MIVKNLFFPNGKWFPEVALVIWVASSLSIFEFIGTSDLVLLFVLLSGFLMKHLLADFHFQDANMAKSKGILFDGLGMLHSFIQAFGSVVVIFFTLGFLFNKSPTPIFDVSHAIAISLLIGAIDFVLHYAIDYTKVNTSRDYTFQDLKYWINLGFDQYLHNLSYLFYAFGVVGLLYLVPRLGG